MPNRRERQSAAVRHFVLVAGAALLVAGCGGEAGGSGGYLARAENGAAYLHWTRDGDQATGSITLARLETKGDGRFELDVDEAPSTAVIDGDDVTLTFEHGLGLTTRWSGRIDGETIVLSYQADDGTFRDLSFERAERDSYNEAVAALQATVADAEAAASKAEATRAAIDQIDAAAAGAWSHIQALQDYPAEFNRLAEEAAEALARVREALMRAEQALARTRAADSFGVCYEGDSTAYEADSVDYEVDSIRSTVETLTDPLSRVNDDIAALEAGVTELDAASSSLPDYSPKTAPAAADVDAAIRNATTVAAAARKKTNDVLAKAQALAAKADEYAAAAKAECERRG